MNVLQALLYSNPIPALDINFLTGSLDSRVTFARASSATDSFYTDSTGSSYNTYSTDIPRMLSTGFLVEETRTNSLLASDTPATQTTASLATGSYTLWVIGTGTAISAAVSATGTTFGTASAGTPNTFTITGAGTVLITVVGSLTRFQLENGAFATTYIPTTVATATRAADTATITDIQWYLQNGPATIIVECIFESATQSTNAFLFGIDDGTLNNSIRSLKPLNITTFQLSLSSGGVSVASTAFGTAAAGTSMRVGTSYTMPGSVVAFNGAGAAPLTTGTAGLDFTAAKIGASGAGAARANYIVSRIRYWRKALRQPQLNGRTA